MWQTVETDQTQHQIWVYNVCSGLSVSVFCVNMLIGYLNPFMSNELFYHDSLDCTISNSRVPGKFLLLLCFIEISVFNANSVDPDQVPHSAASDLDLQFPSYPFRGFQTKMGQPIT